MDKRPQPTHVYEQDGDAGLPWAVWQKCSVQSPAGKQAHAIKFDDGTVFDLHNGWREKTSQGWRRMEDSRIDGTGWAESLFNRDRWGRQVHA